MHINLRKVKDTTMSNTIVEEMLKVINMETETDFFDVDPSDAVGTFCLKVADDDDKKRCKLALNAYAYKLEGKLPDLRDEQMVFGNSLTKYNRIQLMLNCLE